MWLGLGAGGRGTATLEGAAEKSRRVFDYLGSNEGQHDKVQV